MLKFTSKHVWTLGLVVVFLLLDTETRIRFPKFKHVLMLFLNQISERLTLKLGQVFSGRNNSNPFLGTVTRSFHVRYTYQHIMEKMMFFHQMLISIPSMKRFLPPASAVEVIESVSSVRVSVFLSVSEHSHG